MAEEEHEPNLTSLLDIVFLLITFFVVTVNFVQTEEFVESVTLPVASSAVPLDKSATNWIFINVNRAGEVVGRIRGEMDAERATLDSPEQMRFFLRRQKDLLERDAKAANLWSPQWYVVIIIRADREVPYKKIWKLLDACSLAGYERWQLRVMTKQG